MLEAQRDKNKVHFASLVDICHLKNVELEPQFQKYKDRVILRGDTVKDDSGSCAVFTEQGSSATQMTAAKVMDVISRLPDCNGQAADAVSANTLRWRWRMIPDCSEFQSQTVQTYGYVFHDVNGQHHGLTLKIQWFLLNEIGTVTHLQASCGDDRSRKFCCSLDGKWFRFGNVYLFTKKQGDCAYQNTLMTQMTGKRQNMAPICTEMMKFVDLDDPTSFLDHVCSQIVRHHSCTLCLYL